MCACVENWVALPIRRSSMLRNSTLAGLLVKGGFITHERCRGRNTMNASSRHLALAVGVIVVGTLCLFSVPAAAENHRSVETNK
jgi:hypothetical protein